MRGSARQHSATANIGGQEVNIKIDMGEGKALGPIHLAGDDHVPKGVVSAQTQQNMHMGAAGSNSAAFLNPKQNAYKLGFKEGMKVADFGSGSGAYTLVLADVVGTTGTVYAVDVQRDLLTRIQNDAVQRGHENIEIVWADIENVGGVGIKDDLLDGVLLSNTLFQVEDKISVVKEAWRVLKPGGILSVIDWSDSFGGLGPRQDSVITQAEATLICTDNRFALRSDFNAGDHHYGLIFIKMTEGESDDEAVVNSVRKEDDFISRTIAQELV